MKPREYILYGACLLVIGASAYLGKTKEMVSQTFIDRIEANGKVAHIIKQEDCFHPFENIRFRNPVPKYTGVVYLENGATEELTTFFQSRARSFVNSRLENL